ncbi:MAG: hypothetical protein K0M45_10170 [Candidatus Paracaedibacteraceae bacterium]|nr:hypothetical protein [Candidatus Paracaedibacteraceae bacterium]
MKKILLSVPITVLWAVNLGVSCCSFASEEPALPVGKPPRLQQSTSLRDTRSVRDRIKIFEEFSDQSHPKALNFSKICSAEEKKVELSSTGQVSKIRRFFQLPRKKSEEKSPKILQEPKKNSSQALGTSISSSSSPRSARNLYKWGKPRINTSKSLEEIPKEKPKSKKKEKGSRSKPLKNFEVSRPTVNPLLTKQHTFNLENIEKDWEDRIENFNNFKEKVQEHIKKGAISETDERYLYVLKGDLEEFETMYIKGMHYVKGKNSLRKQDPLLGASHIQTMGKWFKEIELEFDWVRRAGGLTPSYLDLFETKLKDAKSKQKVLTSLGEGQENLSKICITHPSPTRRRAHTAKADISSSIGSGKKI